jgi:hypothetical protein
VNNVVPALAEKPPELLRKAKNPHGTRSQRDVVERAAAAFQIGRIRSSLNAVRAEVAFVEFPWQTGHDLAEPRLNAATVHARDNVKYPDSP